MTQYNPFQITSKTGKRVDEVDNSLHSNMVHQQEFSAGGGDTSTTITRESFADEEASKSRLRDLQASTTLTSPAPVTPMRRRLGTEETHRIRNILSPSPSRTAIATPNRDEKYQQPPLSLTLDNNRILNDYNITHSDPDMNDSFTHYDLGPPARDDDTIVSSLSCDEDSLIMAHRNARLPPIRELSKEFPMPPVEVAIPTPEQPSHKRRGSRMEELLANLALASSLSGDHSSVDHSPTSGNTRGLSPSLVRPTLGRNRSCPVRMDFSVASSNISSIRSGTSSIPEDSIVINGSVVEGIRNRDSDILGSHSSHSALLGSRKRRVHRRCHTGTEISIGSIVGQSTLHTSNTSAASFSDSEASSVRQALRSAGTANDLMLNFTGASDGIACCQVRRPKNIVKEEFKYVMGKVTSPIRMIPLFKEKKAELKRAKGSLV